MISSPAAKSNVITAVTRTDSCITLASEAGVLRLMPCSDDIVRVSYSADALFNRRQGELIAHVDDCFWDYEESDSTITLTTKELTVAVSRQTGSVSFYRGTEHLMSERSAASHELERLESIKDKSLYRTRLHLDWDTDEHLYGLGQAEEGALNLRHTTQYLNQANRKIAIPVLMSSKGYGILFSTQSPAIFTDSQYGSYFYTEADYFLDYYFIGTKRTDDAVRGIRGLTGRAVMLPRYAFGYIQSQERYETQDEIVGTVEEFRKRDIPMDTIVLDWMSWPEGQWGQKSYDSSRFPDPDGMVHSLHELGAHYMISVWPTMADGGADNEAFKKAGLMLEPGNFYDALSCEGRALYWKQARTGLYDHGVDAWWCDNCEPVTPEWTDDGIRPEPAQAYDAFVRDASALMPIEQCNAYGLYHSQGMYEGQRSISGGKRVFNLTRNNYIGGQKYGVVLWSGDIEAKWSTLRHQIAAGLNFCATGMPYWTLDAGAFFVKNGKQWYWSGDYEAGADDLGYRELYTRWLQYATFLPIMRSHGTDVRREPWNIAKPGDMFYDAIVNAIRQRYSLLPYIYSLAGSAWYLDDTIMRPLVFDFPDDKKALDIDCEYMFGPSLLVCPVTKPMYYAAGSKPIEDVPRTLSVYLPAGTRWYDTRDNHLYEGGRTVEVSADITSIPVFAREGAIIPTAVPGTNAADTGRDITLRIYRGQDGIFNLYEDAGDGYAYENGEFCFTTIKYDNQKRKMTTSARGDESCMQGITISVEEINPAE